MDGKAWIYRPGLCFISSPHCYTSMLPQWRVELHVSLIVHGMHVDSEITNLSSVIQALPPHSPGDTSILSGKHSVHPSPSPLQWHSAPWKCRLLQQHRWLLTWYIILGVTHIPGVDLTVSANVLTCWHMVHHYKDHVHSLVQDRGVRVLTLYPANQVAAYPYLLTA